MSRHVTIGYDAAPGDAAPAAPPAGAHGASATSPVDYVLAVAAGGADGKEHDFGEIAVLPEAGDNCAIARAVTPRGTLIRLPAELGGGVIALSNTTLEGHRFAVKPIVPGEKLTSWGLVFGEAIAPIAPGE
jgi:altronate dehydratase